MDIKTTKLELMQLLLQTDKESVLKKVKAVLEKEKEDWGKQLSDEEIEEIEIGLQQAERSEFYDHEEVDQLLTRWNQK